MRPYGLTVSVTVAADAIRVTSGYVPCSCGTPVSAHSTFSHVIHAIGSGRWSKPARAYLFPISPFMAETIDKGLVGQNIVADNAFLGLLRQARVIHGAASIKTTAALPDIPGIATPAWMHQKQAYWFAHSMPACNLAMEMGTGKSLVGIALMRARQVKTALIVTKKKAISVWPAEIAKHAPDWRPHIEALTEDAISKRTASAQKALAVAQATGETFILVTNYDAVWQGDLGAWLPTVGWGQVILDEIHRIKSPSGKASNYLWRLGQRAQWRLGLTGTPLPHSLLDGFAQARFLDPGLFGTSYYLFKQHFTNPHPAIQGALHQKVPFKNEREFHSRFFTITFRVTKDVLDLPPESSLSIDVDLPPAARKVYDELQKQFVADIALKMGGQATVTAGNALVRMLRLQQLTSGFITDDAHRDVMVHTAKQDALDDWLEDIAQDEPVVVFCRFTHDLLAVAGVAAGAKRIYGEISGSCNDLADFQAGRIQVLGVQIQAGGEAIDLTRARYAVYYSLGTSLGDYVQSQSRVHRPGQTRPTFYYHLLAKNTVDPRIYKALKTREFDLERILAEMVKDVLGLPE